MIVVSWVPCSNFRVRPFFSCALAYFFPGPLSHRFPPFPDLYWLVFPPFWIASLCPLSNLVEVCYLCGFRFPAFFSLPTLPFPYIAVVFLCAFLFSFVLFCFKKLLFPLERVIPFLFPVASRAFFLHFSESVGDVSSSGFEAFALNPLSFLKFCKLWLLPCRASYQGYSLPPGSHTRIFFFFPSN